MTETITTQQNGAAITQPREHVEQTVQTAIDMLAKVIQALHPFLSTQTALQRLTETKFWTSHALADQARFESEQAALKLRKEKEAQANNVREKVEVNALNGNTDAG